jgi:hypothetical protein
MASKHYVRLVVIGSLLILARSAAAQNTGFAGVVRDASGGALPGVVVEASSPALIEKSRSTVTDEQGLYQIVDLRPGVYVVTFALPGFATVNRAGLSLSAGVTATVNIVMQVSGIEETITVSGESAAVDIRNVALQRVLREETREALPTARSLQVMGSLIPGMVATAANAPAGQDVGGLSGERGQLLIHGSRGGDMTIQLDGMQFNSVQTVGSTQYYTLNPAEAQEYQFTVAAISADTMTGGVRANAIPKEGGNRFSGTFFAAHTSGDLQSDNLSQALIDRGLQAANPIEQIYDYNASLGGPILRDKIWFYGSFRAMDQREQVAGMFRPIDPLSYTFNPALGEAGNVDLSQPAIFDSWLKSYGLRVTWQINPKNRVSMYAAHQPNGQTPQFMSGTRSYEAASLRRSPLSRMFQTSWRSTISTRLLLEASFMAWDNRFTQTPTASWITPDLVGVRDTGTGMTFRSSPRYYEARFHQPLTKVAASYVTGSHAIKVGADVQWGYSQFGPNLRNLGMTYVLQNGTPRQLDRILSPYTTQEDFWQYAVYAQDQWTVRRMTINAGMRFDYQDQSIPEQFSGPGPSTPAQTWPAIPNVVSWKDFSPRLGVAYDLFGNGNTALKATVSRYPVRDTTGFAANNNPLTFNLTATQPWTDANRDMIPQPSELGALSNANWGTAATTRTVDPALATGWHVRPTNWEYTAGIQHQLLRQLSVGVAYVHRSYRNFSVVDNQLIGPEDFSPFCVMAPSHPDLPGGGGYEICGLYDLNPDKRGQVQNFQTFSKNYGEQSETFDGVDVVFGLRLPNVEVHGGIASGTSNNSGNSLRNSTNACFVVDSPQLLHCDIDMPWRTQYKMLASVSLPWAINVGTTFQSVPGSEITASYTVNSSQTIGLGRALSGGTFTVPLVQPGTMFNERTYQTDVRVSKAFRFGNFQARAIVDIGNLFNSSPVLLQNNTFGQNWQRPAYILPGRILKPSVEIRF